MIKQAITLRQFTDFMCKDWQYNFKFMFNADDAEYLEMDYSDNTKCIFDTEIGDLLLYKVDGNGTVFAYKEGLYENAVKKFGDN